MPFCRLMGVTVRFGGLVALDSVDMIVNHGEIVGVIGPNGAGKTTLFNCITGLQRVDRGRILFAGRDITRLRPHQRSRLGIARTFQTVRLFGSLTVRENILVGCHAHLRSGLFGDGLRLPTSIAAERRARREVDQLLEILDLDAVADRTAAELPLGLQRRTEIGRALATRPKLLLLDEAASGMTRRESSELVDLFRRLRRTFDLSMLVVEHDVGLVMALCSFVYVLDFGKIIAAGTPSEVRRDPAVVEAYLGHLDDAAREGPLSAAVPTPGESEVAAHGS